MNVQIYLGGIMTKTLTEQWREGTLPEGLYYIEGKVTHDIALIRNRYCPILTSPYCEDNVFEPEFVPVAPVPSYDEYQQLVSNSDESVQKIHILNEQNTKQYNELCEEIKKNNILEKKLAIATKALKKINRKYRFTVAQDVVYKALREMEGVK